MFDLMIAQIANLSIPVPVTLACACICAYMLGKIPKDYVREDTEEPNAPGQSKYHSGVDRRADRLINKLTTEVENFHRDLDAHTESLKQLQAAIAQIDRADNPAFNDQTNQALRSIQRHCQEIPIAFDEIRQTTKSAVESLASHSPAETNAAEAKSSS